MWLALLALTLAAPPALAADVSVPTVACPRDGQQGPAPPLPPDGTNVRLPAGVAPHLAYYRGAPIGVLAPRSWHCLELSGSSGVLLVVTPQPYAFDDLNDLRGPAVQLSWSHGGTSGRFAVARMIARLFPGQMDFARQVAAEQLDDRPLPDGPFADDEIRRDGAHVVRYRTPAGRQGLGTESRLAPDQSPIDGAVVLMMADGERDLLSLSVRLAPAQAELSPVIVGQMLGTSGSGPRPAD